MECAKLLLQAGSNPGSASNYAIIRASENGHAGIVELLMKHKTVNPSDCNNAAVILAAQNGRVEVVEALVKSRRANARVDQCLPFRYACENGHKSTVNYLLTQTLVKMDVSACENYAFLKASANGHLEIVRLLLEHCPTLDLQNGGNESLKLACSNGHVEMVQFLINGARISPDVDNNAAIRAAVQHNRPEIVKILLEDTRTDPSVEENYCLRTAGERGWYPLLKILLEHELVDPSVAGQYAMCVASRNGWYKCVEVLLRDDRVDPAANNNLPLREAARYGHHKVVRLLLKSEKVDPSAAGFEALLSAVRHGHRFVVDALLGSGDYDFALIAQERERGREMRKSLRQAVQNFEPVFKEWRGPNLDVLQPLDDAETLDPESAEATRASSPPSVDASELKPGATISRALHPAPVLGSIKVSIQEGRSFPAVSYFGRLNMNFSSASKSRVFKKDLSPVFAPPLCCFFTWKSESLPPALLFELIGIKTAVFGKNKEELLGAVQLGLSREAWEEVLSGKAVSQWLSLKDPRGHKMNASIRSEIEYHQHFEK